MTAAELRAWRERQGFTAKAAAEALGLSQNGYAAYERGYVTYSTRDEPLASTPYQMRPVPKHVALACAAITAGLRGWA